jgi:hypothetical protein
MENKYVIIDSIGGWFVNIVVWDGNTNVWQPPAGTYAVPATEVDFRSLPNNPYISI